MSDVKEDIREKFGVSWLGGNSAAATSDAPAAGPSAGVAAQVDATQAMLGARILRLLKETPDHADRVHSLVDQMQLDISSVLAVVDWLESAGFVRIERNNYGNHLLSLTEAGEAWSQ
jgi:hypothetical protein